MALIVEARVEELFEYVQKELDRIHKARKLPGGVVLVGGTSKLPGIAEYAKERLELASRLGKLQAISGLVESVSDPAYAAAVGLMILDMLMVPDPAGQLAPNTSARALKLVDSLLARFKH